MKCTLPPRCAADLASDAPFTAVEFKGTPSSSFVKRRPPQPFPSSAPFLCTPHLGIKKKRLSSISQPQVRLDKLEARAREENAVPSAFDAF